MANANQSGASCGVPGSENPALPDQQLFFANLGETDFFSGVDSDSSRKYAESTGTTVERRGQVAEVAMTLHLQGWSQHQISAQLGIARNSVAALIERWRANGKLEPLKQRLSKILGRAVELGVEAWTEALESGRLKPETIPIAVGIFSDKKALLDGEATQRIETTHTGPTIEGLRDYLASLPAAQATVLDKNGPQKDHSKDYAAPTATEPTDNKELTHETD